MTNEKKASGITRRQFNKTMLTIGAGAVVYGSGLKSAFASKTKVVSWSPTGGRWEIPSRALKPDFEKINQNVDIEIIATPIGEQSAKMGVVLGSKSSSYDTIYGDYGPLYPFIIGGYLEPLNKYLDEDPEFRDDILKDIPQNVLDTYRNPKTGELFGLPPDSNTQLTFYRADVFEKKGIKVPKTWDDAILTAKELTGGGQYGFTCGLRRGAYTVLGWQPIFYSCGGDWFDKWEKGYYNSTLLSDAGVKSVKILKELIKYAAPGTLNAVDDETNEHLIRGTAVYGPIQWAAPVFTDPKICKFASEFKASVVPTQPGHNPVPTLGGLGFVIPISAKNKKMAWNWIKYCNSKEVQEKWVQNTGQPSRISSLKRFQNIQSYFGALMDSIPIARRYIPLAEVWGIYDAVGTEIAGALVGNKSVEEALENSDKAVNRIMQKSGYKG